MKVKLNRQLSALILVLILILAIAACSNETDETVSPVEEEAVEVNAEADAGESNIDESGAEQVELPFQAPLTGVGSEEELDRRVIGVMIDNHNQARPQTGLSQADFVYEVLAEGFITRFAALFQSEIPEVVGPVRSIRPYYIDLITGFDGVLAHAGGSPAATEEVNTLGLPSINNNGRGGFAFYRDGSRNSPHNLYTGKEQLTEGLQRLQYEEDYRIPSLSFKMEGEEPGGTEAESIQIDYGNGYSIGYEYDQESRTYTRYTKGEPHLDHGTGEPVTMSNVLVIETAHQVLDDAGRRAIDVEGEGKGFLFQRGSVQEVDWKREDGLIRPFVEGQETGLYPGKTWVNIIPNQPGLAENVQVH